MKKEIIVNRSLEEIRVAILEDGHLSDLFIERRESEKMSVFQYGNPDFL